VSDQILSNEIKPNNIVFHTQENNEILKIGPDGFWVRGVAVEQGPGEAREVYNAFLEFLNGAGH